MAELSNEQIHRIPNFDGMQAGVSRFNRKTGELAYAQNANYDEVGGIGKKQGYAQRGNALTSTTSTSSSTSSTTSTTTTA